MPPVGESFATLDPASPWLDSQLHHRSLEIAMPPVGESFATLDPASPWLDPDTAAATRPLSPTDQRRLRRKISNRESARRCRMRKQRYLEELLAESARLQSLNQELAGRVGDVSQRCLLLRHVNESLHAESTALSRRLLELRRLLHLRQLVMASAPPAPAGLFGVGYEQALASLMA